MAFCWRADDDPLRVILGPPSSTKNKKQKKTKKKKRKKVVKVGPPLTKFSGSAHADTHLPKQSSQHMIIIVKRRRQTIDVDEDTDKTLDDMSA